MGPRNSTKIWFGLQISFRTQEPCLKVQNPSTSKHRWTQNGGIRVSLFIAPDIEQIEKAIMMNVPVVEIHTGHYANFKDRSSKLKELNNIKDAVDFAYKAGLVVNAGHGLHYDNVKEIVEIKNIKELNIGHSIVAEALFIGWEKAIKNMKKIITMNTIK